MRQPITIRNSLDELGRPAGGSADNEGSVYIAWQDGPVQDGKPNGAFVEDIIEIAQRRLEFYQMTQFACDENASAIRYLQGARDTLAARFARREAAGTANSYEGN